ncbi:molybdenum cofactor guanylyltransferase [bacterium]|nr:molybdenum cofactor guanylyltransferase [bacterium]
MRSRKEWLTLEGETLLARLTRELSSVVEHVLVATGKDSPVPPLPSSIPIVRDIHDNRGPLAGMYAGFSALPPHSDRAFVISCDMPFIDSSIIWKLDDQLNDAWCALPVINEAPQPLCAIYRREALANIEVLLNVPRTGPRDLLRHLKATFIYEDQLRSIDPELRAFRSFNTPSEWAEIRMSFDT